VSMHKFSFISGKENRESLGIEYVFDGERIKGYFIPKSTHTSHKDIFHGGLLSAILDDAMATLLLEKGIKAYTGKLNVRFREKVYIKDVIFIEAWIEKSRPPLFITKGVIKKNDLLCVEAEASFFSDLS